MANSRTVWLLAGLAAGLVIGLNLAGLWPQVPVHAVATHGQDNFAIATGPLDENVEAVFVLDSLTGDLKAAAMNVQSRRFNTWYEYNVSRDLPVSGSKNAAYRIVTGFTNIRQVPAAGQLGAPWCTWPKQTAASSWPTVSPGLRDAILLPCRCGRT